VSEGVAHMGGRDVRFQRLDGLRPFLQQLRVLLLLLRLVPTHPECPRKSTWMLKLRTEREKKLIVCCCLGSTRPAAVHYHEKSALNAEITFASAFKARKHSSRHMYAFIGRNTYTHVYLFKWTDANLCTTTPICTWMRNRWGNQASDWPIASFPVRSRTFILCMMTCFHGRSFIYHSLLDYLTRVTTLASSRILSGRLSIYFCRHERMINSLCQLTKESSRVTPYSCSSRRPAYWLKSWLPFNGLFQVLGSFLAARPALFNLPPEFSLLPLQHGRLFAVRTQPQTLTLHTSHHMGVSRLIELLCSHTEKNW